MKRPWNLIDYQVYSLATYDHDKVNMNILTYATGVSMKPKKYVLGVYLNTKTLENLNKNEHAVLQILTTDHINLVRLLGKRSGMNTDKHQYLSKKDVLDSWKGNLVLSNCAGLIHLQKIESKTTGDHELVILDVKAYSSFLTSAELLNTKHLHDKNIIAV